jgi:hypothetical protein
VPGIARKLAIGNRQSKIENRKSAILIVIVIVIK